MSNEEFVFDIDPEIIVQAFDVEVTLEAFEFNQINQFFIEYGGVTDPLGQLASAIMNFVDSVVDRAKNTILSSIDSIYYSLKGVIEGIESAIKSAIDSAKGSIIGAIDGIKSLVNNVSSTIQNIGSSLQSAISSLSSSISASISSLSSSLQSAINSVHSAIQSIGNSIQSAISSVSNTISSAIGSLQSTLGNMINNITNAIQGAITTITNTIQNLINQIVNTIQSAFQSFSGTLQSLMSSLSSAISSIAQTIQSQFSGFIGQVSSLLQGIINQIQGLAQNIANTVSNAIGTIQTQLGNIGQKLVSSIQGVVGSIQSALTSFIGEISKIATNIYNTIQNAFKGFVDKIKPLFDKILTSIKSVITDAFEFLKDIPSKIGELASKIPEIPKEVEKLLKPIIEPIVEKIKDIPEKMLEISKAFQGFVNPLVSIAQFFDQIRQKVLDFFGGVAEWVTTGWQNFVDFIKSIPEKIGGVIDTLKKIGQYIYDHAIKPFLDWYRDNIVKPIADFVYGFVDWVTTGWQNFVDFVKQIPENIKNIGQFIYDHAIKPLQDWFSENVVKPAGELFKPISEFFGNLWKTISQKFKQFIDDPIGSISYVLQEVFDKIKGFISWLIEGASNVLMSIYQTLVSAFSKFMSKIHVVVIDIFTSAGQNIVNAIWGAVKKLIDVSKSIQEQVGKIITNIILSVYEPFYKSIAKPIKDAAQKVLNKVIEGTSRGEIIELTELLGLSFGTIIGAQYLARGLHITLSKIAGWLNQFEHSFTIRVRGSGEAKGEPLGVGAGAQAGGSGGYTYTMRFNLGYTLKKIAKEIEKYPDELGRAIIYGYSIWLSQPMMRLASALFRDMFPVELPSLAEMREITRRHMPIKQEFENNLVKMRQYLALYGYNSDVVSWLTTPVTEEGWYVEFLDRFGNVRKAPISLLYELPTASDIARMMIHDLFSYPDLSEEEIIQNFTKLMSMRGYNEDIAKLYYLLHYKYPSMDKLWEFSCRVVARQTWVTTQPKKEKDLGYDGLSPEALQKIYGFTNFTSDNVAEKLKNIIDNVLKYYAKWHDYAPFPWLKKWTADNLIYLDLMADIPQRIDARWMYKWQVPIPKDIQQITNSKYFDEKALFMIVTSRGMHPKWIEPITIAECMNALQEERTLARTGVINAFKEGFMTLDALNQTLSNLTTIKILGKDVPIRFLDGEVKLLSIRAKYDRALDILRDYFRDLLRAVSENIMTFKEMVTYLAKEVVNIGKSLGLQNLSLDNTYYELYEPVATSLNKVRTIERIRYWYRYMLYRILYRFSEGFMSKEEFNKIIDDIVNNAKLTDEEKKVFLEVANLMYEGFYKKTLADGILHKVKRGVIDPNVAKKELIKLGLTEDLADALIEKSVKIYTLSISTLLSYAEYIDIPEDFVRKKLEWMGVPEDEIPIILQVFRIRPIKDERAKMIRSVIDAYIDGYITKELFRTNLKNLGKSEREIKILEEFADFEKSQARAKIMIDAILNKLRRGAITLEEAKRELGKIVVDKALVDAMIEKYVRTSVWSPDKLVSMAEYVPIDIQKLVEKAKMFGYPDDEVNKYPAYVLARNLNEEIGRIVNELVYLYVYDIIDEETLRKEIDKVRTLNGEVKKYGVDWIVIDDIEKELIIQRAKLRKMREQKKT